MRFLSTPSARRATSHAHGQYRNVDISIHALREEGDLSVLDTSVTATVFLSTPSARRATISNKAGVLNGCLFLSTPSARRATRESSPVRYRKRYFYPRPPRGGRPDLQGNAFCAAGISIHALREEGDPRAIFAPSTADYFYPRPPRGGRRSGSAARRSARQFLSTPSARRATTGGRAVVRHRRPISIHALREEGDLWTRVATQSPANFYPRPPRGGRRISLSRRSTARNFYPRPPRGGRREKWVTPIEMFEFLSTPSARRATNRIIAETIGVEFLSTPSARRATARVRAGSQND